MRFPYQHNEEMLKLSLLKNVVFHQEAIGHVVKQTPTEVCSLQDSLREV